MSRPNPPWWRGNVLEQESRGMRSARDAEWIVSLRDTRRPNLCTRALIKLPRRGRLVPLKPDENEKAPTSAEVPRFARQEIAHLGFAIFFYFFLLRGWKSCFAMKFCWKEFCGYKKVLGIYFGRFAMIFCGDSDCRKIEKGRKYSW